jgi:hypothetical protein
LAPERVHEAPGADVAVGARERVAVEVPGAAAERQRAVDDPRRGLVDERLRGLGLGEQAHQVGLALVDEQCGARQDRPRGAEVDRVLGQQHQRAGALAADRVRRRRLGDPERSGGME